MHLSYLDEHIIFKLIKLKLFLSYEKFQTTKKGTHLRRRRAWGGGTGGHAEGGLGGEALGGKEALSKLF